MRTHILWPAATALAVATAGITLFSNMASAQTSTGTVTGRVTWNACLRYPLPYASGAPVPGGPIPPSGSGTVSPGGSDSATSAPSLAMPYPIRPIPAGAVLVAAQGTAQSTRTDENGQFTLTGLPSGQFLTVAAGPVATASNAWASRPNVMVSAAQTVDLGTLTLGTTVGASIPCGALGPALGAPQGVPGASPASPDASNAPSASGVSTPDSSVAPSDASSAPAPDPTPAP